MKNILLTLTALFISSFVSAQQVPTLGQSWTPSAQKSNKLFFIPSGFHSSSVLNIKKIDYDVVTENNIVKFISTRSKNFEIDGIKHIGLKLADFQNKSTIKLYQGWGYYLPLDKEWYAYFGDKNLSDSSEVLSIFKYKF